MRSTFTKEELEAAYDAGIASFDLRQPETLLAPLADTIDHDLESPGRSLSAGETIAALEWLHAVALPELRRAGPSVEAVIAKFDDPHSVLHKDSVVSIAFVLQSLFLQPATPLQIVAVTAGLLALRAKQAKQ